MSIKLVRDVFQYAPADLTANERLVLLALAEDARDDRIARYSSRERLEQFTGVRGTSLKRAIRALEDAGLIARVGGAHKGRVQQYRIAELHAHHTATNVHYLPGAEPPKGAHEGPTKGAHREPPMAPCEGGTW